MKLDQFLAKNNGVSRRSARLEIAAGRVQVDGRIELDHGVEIDRFQEVVFSGKVIQKSTSRIYIMLNKPRGYVSATTDPEHPTVVDLIDHPERISLHLAGRLDRSSTGLILLTNDSAWSEGLSQPGNKVEKVYLVETTDPIPERAVELFEQGFYFEHEDITTSPALLELLEPCRARVTITEGKYHQIKRMFHRIDGLRLRSLHRISVGDIVLPDDLGPGEWREFAG